MPKMLSRILFLLLSFLTSVTCFAQTMQSAAKVPMADELRASGKIYVVVAVLVTILTGIVLYMIRLDKKISRLEKR